MAVSVCQVSNLPMSRQGNLLERQGVSNLADIDADSLLRSLHAASTPDGPGNTLR